MQHVFDDMLSDLKDKIRDELKKDDFSEKKLNRMIEVYCDVWNLKYEIFLSKSFQTEPCS